MPPPAANLVLHNAQIYTVDDRRPTASALAVRNGRFVAVGDRDAATAACPEAPRVDAEGHTVVPGFIDAHAHLQALGHSLRRAALAGTSSPGAVVERLEEFATERDLPADAWVRGHGWDQNNWTPPRFPTRTVLDAAFPDRPVWLTRTDVHVGWANTAALNATVGLDRLRTMDDPAGGRI
jgi:predicted amidohydrolase YtcJ